MSKKTNAFQREVKKQTRRDVKTDRIYGDQVLLCWQQVNNDMSKFIFGHGGCKTQGLSRLEENTDHPGFRGLGDRHAFACCDSWNPHGPKYAGQRSAHIHFLPKRRETPFSLFMKRTINRRVLGWEYCGEYKAEDPDDEIESYVHAHSSTEYDKTVLAQSLLQSAPGRILLDQWRKNLVKILDQDRFPASHAPEWFMKGRKERITPLASRAKALGFEPNISDRKLANILPCLDEFHTSKPIKFVGYNSNVYEQVQHCETDKNAAGEIREIGEPCAKASDWYSYCDHQVLQ